jgi:hypothetical protein
VHVRNQVTEFRVDDRVVESKLIENRMTSRKMPPGNSISTQNKPVDQSSTPYTVSSTSRDRKQNRCHPR